MDYGFLIQPCVNKFKTPAKKNGLRIFNLTMCKHLKPPQKKWLRIYSRGGLLLGAVQSEVTTLQPRRESSGKE
jgi:hypothetical protein